MVRSAGVAVAELGVGDYFGESGLLSATNLVKGAVESVSCVSTMATDYIRRLRLRARAHPQTAEKELGRARVLEKR